MSTVAVEQALSAPPEEVGTRLLSLPEGQWFDRKSARIAARDLARHLIAFANAEGGHIVLGLRDGRVEGTASHEGRRNEQRQAGLDFAVPPVRARVAEVPCLRDDGADDTLLVFDVEPSEGVVATPRDEVYLRVGDESRHLSFVQRQELLYDKGQSSYETRPVEDAGFELLDESLLGQYAAALGHLEPHRLLIARGLARMHRLNVAGCLLFAEAPEAFFPEAFVRVLRYRGRERGAGARQQLLRDVRLEGPLPRQLVDAAEAIRAEQPVRTALTSSGRFGDVALVPEDAWLEGLVNAVIHRSYSFAGDHIRVEIFDDRIEIESPGRFPGLVDVSDPLNVTRFARNPRIARVCSDLQFGQELGEGIRRIFEEMRQAGLTDPRYRQSSGSVRLTLFTEPVDRRLDALYPQEVRAITAALREASRMSTGEVTQLLGVSRPTAIELLRTLEGAGVIRWVGRSPRDPRAYWTLEDR